MDPVSFLLSLSVPEVCFVNTYAATQKDYPIRQRARMHHGFVYTVTGSEIYRFADRTVRAVPHSLLYLPKGAAYSVLLDGEESVVIDMDFELSGEGSEPFAVTFPGGGAAYACFTEAMEKWERAAAYPAFCKALLLKAAALAAAKEEQRASDRAANLLKDAVDYLHAHYTDPDFRVGTLYDTAGISARYFCTLFERQFGMTPKEYVVFLKIERAKKLLLGEKGGVQTVAEQLGYADVYHFSKIFKAKTGFSPSAFRRL